MFHKPIRVKTQTTIKGSDRKKLRADIQIAFPFLSHDQLTALIPNKGDMTVAKVTTHSANQILVYCLAKNPVFFDVDKRLYPTVYTLWMVPELIPCFTTWPQVFTKLSAGADLMLPGVVLKGAVNEQTVPSVEVGDCCGVSCVPNRAAMCVGTALLSSADMVASRMRGKGVKVIHCYGDHIWSMGDKSDPPSFPDDYPPCHDTNSDERLSDSPNQNDSPNSTQDDATTQRTDNLVNPQQDDLPKTSNTTIISDRIDNQNGVDDRLTQLQIDDTIEDRKDGAASCDDIHENGADDDELSPLQTKDEMDRLLYDLFLTALKVKVVKSDLPMLSSVFYRKCMLACCPASMNADVRQSSYKKLSKFLTEMQKLGFIKMKETSKGVDSVMEVDRLHEKLKSFEPPEEYLNVENEETTTTTTTSDKTACQPPVITEMYAITTQLLPLVKPFGLRETEGDGNHEVMECDDSDEREPDEAMDEVPQELDHSYVLLNDRPKTRPEPNGDYVESREPGEYDEGEIEEMEQPEVTGSGVEELIRRVDTPSDIVDDTTYLVYSKPLMDLANAPSVTKCRVATCRSPVLVVTRKHGSAIYIKWICGNEHVTRSWCSQPVINRGQCAGDLAMSASLLMSGNNFSKVQLFSKFLNLNFFSPSTFFRMQKTYLTPTIKQFWTVHQNHIIDQFKGQDLIIMGDGRMDSPGHCAQFCTYTIMEYWTKTILCVITKDKRTVDRKSANLEKACFLEGMRFLISKGLKIVEVITDAHVQIAAVMKTSEFQHIKHSNDTWHGTKNIIRRIIAAAKEKGASPLLPWAKDIGNQCNGGGPQRMQKRETNFLSTSHIETFQNTILKYATKRVAFTPPVYEGRCLLAALDHNLHLGRPYALSKNGEIRYARHYNKKSARWNVSPMKVDKDYTYVNAIMHEIAQERIGNTTGMRDRSGFEAGDPRLLSRVLAPVPPPPTAEIVANQKARSSRKGQAVSGSDLRAAVTEYIRTNGLQDKSVVCMDPVLASVVLRKDENHVTHLGWDVIITRCMEKSDRVHQISVGGKPPVTHKGSLQPISMEVKLRASNKKVTLIDHVELYGIDPLEFSQRIKHAVACSVSVVDTPQKNKGQQVVVQGNQINFVSRLLLDVYKLPPLCIKDIEKVVKKKK